MITPATPDDEKQRMDAPRQHDLFFTPAEERFDRITRIASRLLGTPIALVNLVADKCQWLKSAQGLSADEMLREISFCSHAVLGDETFVVENALEDARFSGDPLVTGDPHIRFYAGHPLHAEDRSRVGTLCVIDRVPRKPTPSQLEDLRDLAAIAENELQHRQLSQVQLALSQERDELQRKAMIDGLTRLWNRAAIMELLEAELARANRGAPMCVAMIDVDHFKNVNDRYGHQTGDAVLVELAARFRRATREFDLVGRYGGEEFIVVLVHCSFEIAKVVAERIRSRVADAPFSTPAGQLAVTVSVGLAAYDAAHADSAQLIGAADAALYRAKSNGRNRVEY